MKTCVKCNKTKPLEDFHNRKDSKDGKQGKCKVCSIEIAKQWQKDNPDRYELYWRARDDNEDYRISLYLRRRARTYGLSVEELQNMLNNSGGVCEICKREPNRWLVIDHCHNTLKVRGVLCEKCNQGLGLFDDNIDWLENAAAYLKK